MIPRMQQKYKDEVVAGMRKAHQYENIMEIPRLEKIVLNVGMGKAVSNPKLLDVCKKELGIISGQRPVLTKARKSEAGFKLRAGMLIGCMVTLRNKHMFYFLDRLINVTFPNIRDFRGFSRKAFDGRGNYNLGVKEQLIFPEIKYDDIVEVNGMNISIVTSARTDKEALTMLELLGFPFREA